MVANTHRPRSLRRPARRVAPASSRRVRARLGALASSVLLTMGVASCGLDVQTSQPYTPAEGINLNAGDVAIRNVLIISRSPGSGILSGSLVSDGSDTLTGVSGNAIKADGSAGAPLTATLPAPVTVGGGRLVVLTQGPLITVSSADLQAGLTAQLMMTFAQGGQVSTIVPVVEGSEGQWSSITPTPAPATVVPAG